MFDNNISTQNKILFWFVIIDVFLLPYFNIVSIPFSTPFIIVWAILNNRIIRREKIYSYFIICIFLMLIAVLICPIWTGFTYYDTSIGTCIKRTIQYCGAVCYFLYFKYIFKRANVNVSRICFWVICYIFVFAVLYYISPLQYLQVKHAIHPADSHSYRAFMGEVIYRFNFLWTDPNNVAYASVALCSFYMCFGENVSKKTIALIGTAFILTCCMSNGGFIAFGVCTVLFVLGNCKRTISLKILKRILFTVVIVCLLAFLFRNKISRFLSSDTVMLYLNRRKTYAASNVKMGGRLQDFIDGIELFNPLFLLLGSGHEGYVSEIGHIYFMYMYGLPVYLFYLLLMFRKRVLIMWKEYIPMISLFIGFTVNIAILEQKFLIITMMFSAFLELISDARRENLLE